MVSGANEEQHSIALLVWTPICSRLSNEPERSSLDEFVVTGCTESCQNDNKQTHQHEFLTASDTASDDKFVNVHGDPSILLCTETRVLS